MADPAIEPDAKCDRCSATLYVEDGTLVEVTARFRSAGWTSPSPFTDRCPACSKAYPPPIRVRCEGSGHRPSATGGCPACDANITVEASTGRSLISAHDRNDVVAMVARGDFDA